MAPYFYPLISLALDFICLALCVKFLFSRKGLAWLLPLLMSIFIMLASAICLLAEVSDALGPNLSEIARIATQFVLILSGFWFIIILVFRVTLKERSPYVDKARINETEARYVRKGSMPDSYMEYVASEKEKQKNRRKAKQKQQERLLRQQLAQKKRKSGPVAALPLKKTYGSR